MQPTVRCFLQSLWPQHLQNLKDNFGWFNMFNPVSIPIFHPLHHVSSFFSFFSPDCTWFLHDFSTQLSSFTLFFTHFLWLFTIFPMFFSTSLVPFCRRWRPAATRAGCFEGSGVEAVSALGLELPQAEAGSVGMETGGRQGNCHYYHYFYYYHYYYYDYHYYYYYYHYYNKSQ